MRAAPLPRDEARRLAALLECGVLDTEDEAAFDDLTRLAARLFDVPIALVSLIDRDRQWFKAKVGLEARETGRDVAFCAHAILGEGLMTVPDTRLDDRFQDNPLVTGPPHIRFYAGAPLRSAEGLAYGTLCLIGDRPGTLGDEQAEVLRGLARQAAAQLELRRANRRLEREMAVRRDAEHALQRARDEAEAANQAKSSFLAKMSHEIRTPLGAILGFSEQLLGAPDASEEQRRDWTRTISTSAEHLLALVNDILDVSKIEAKRMTFESIPTDPLAVAREAAALLRPKAAEKGLELVFEPTGALPPAIRCDPTRLKQVLINLLSNAVKFTETGRVELRIEPRGGEEPRVAFSVHDTGPGIEPGHLEHLFNAFIQVDQTVTRRHGGTGLGLYISREICRSLGGDLTVESTPGRGSVFTAEVAAAEVGVPLTRAGAKPEAPCNQPGCPSCRVLIVDDCEANLKLFSLVLRRAGFEVVVAADGRAALDACDPGAIDGAPHLVLMDVQMPVLDGLEATRRLRARGFRRPIIALTADATPETRHAALAAGCDDHLTKPLRSERLLAAVEDHLRQTPASADGRAA